MKRFTSKTQKVGEIGEKIAEMFLVKHGFTIIDRNFTHKLGEIDIIAKQNNKLFFFEVKTIVNKNTNPDVTHETYINKVSRVTESNIRQNVLKNERETSVKHVKSRIPGHNGHVKDIQNDTKNVFEKINDVFDVDKKDNYKNRRGVSRETSLKDTTQKVRNVPYNKISAQRQIGYYNPFENMSYSKMRKFAKVVEIYLAQKRVSHETHWQIDGLGVILKKNPGTGKVFGKVLRIENVVIR